MLKCQQAVPTAVTTVSNGCAASQHLKTVYVWVLDAAPISSVAADGGASATWERESLSR